MRSSFRARSRGQVLVMACLTFLLLALTLMASFSISHSVHERVRIQSAADQQAFSIAVIEARGFNTLAYMNRAIAGAIVAELSLHAWRAIAGRDVSMYQAGFISFLMVAAMEFAQCPKFQIQHCIHGIQALRIAFKYNSKHRSTKSDLEGKDNQWKEAVKGFSDMIKDIYKDEQDMLDKVKDEVNGGMTLQMVQRNTAPNASMEKFEDYNTVNLACAVEGSKFDDKCKALDWKQATGVSAASTRTGIMEQAALAARMPLNIGRMGSRSLSADGYHSMDPISDQLLASVSPESDPLSLMLGGFDPDISNNPDNMMDIQSEGGYREISIMAEDISLGNNRISASEPISFVLVNWKHGNGFFITNGSAPNSSGSYEGVPCNGSGGCFINYRMGQKSNPPDDDSDWNQPATYGGMKQDLRSIQGGGKGAWEIEGKGEVQMVGGDKSFKYVSDGQAFAVAKGKTYFHQLGDWNVAPNFFDPFWRAKLHPFLRKEMGAALDQLGDSKGAETIRNNQTAVEGWKR
ncbi:MAG: hypothetical protein JNM17_05065 [Archangium sp.]|nr:hypothetical protein [Archangium sp.]